MRRLLAVAALGAVSCGVIAVASLSSSAQVADRVVEEGYFTGSDGNQLYYRKVGAGRPTLVYLHGGPWNMNDGGYEIDRLGWGRTLIVFDQRSGGKSELVQDEKRLEFALYVADLEALRAHFGLETMILAGQSFGAVVAATYALEHPGRVTRMMLWSPMYPASVFFPARDAAFRQFVGDADAGRVAEIARRMLTAPDEEVVALCREDVRLTFRFYLADVASLDRMRGDYCAGAPAAIRHHYRAMDYMDRVSMADFDLRPRLRTLDIPTLVFEGVHTRVPLDATEEWARVMPDARLILIPGASHQTWLEGGNAFFEAAETFLAGDWPPTARVVGR